MLQEVVVSDDDEDVIVTRKSKRVNDRTSIIFIPDGDYGDEVLFVEPADYSPKKRLKLDEEQRTAAIAQSSVETNSEISVTFDRQGVVFPHAREHCKVKKFVQNPSITTKNAINEEFCEKCYCFVCDDISSKCELWKTGEKPHCNAYAKNAFWEKERKLHKRSKKKTQFVPILELLSPAKISLEMNQTAKECFQYVNQMQEVSNSSYDMLTHMSCLCYCHADGFPMDCGCYNCEQEHRISYYRNGYGGSMNLKNYWLTNKLREIVSNATNLAENYLKRKQPNSAMVVLDTIISLLLSLDINSDCSIGAFEEELLRSRLASCWIEAALDKNVEPDMLRKAKERVSNSANNVNQVYHCEAKKLERIVSQLKSYDDPLVVKCLTQKYKGSSSGLKESVEVVKIRLQYFKTNNKIPEAINYILGAEVEAVNSLLRATTQRLCDFNLYRIELVELLIKEGRMVEALNVCTIAYASKLPTNIMKTPSSKDKSINLYGTPAKDIPLDAFKKFFLGLAHTQTTVTSKNQAKLPKNTSSASEQGLLKAMAITLPALCVNGKLTQQEFYESLFDVISTKNKNYKYVNKTVRKEVQLSAVKLMERIASKGNHQYPPEDIKAPNNVPLQVYLVEILLLLASSRLTVYKCLQSLVKKELYWACLSLILFPQKRNPIKAIDVIYFTENILHKIDCNAIPMEVFDKWFTCINVIVDFQALFKLFCAIFEAGTKKQGLDGIQLKKKAALLSQKLIESLLINSYGYSEKLIQQQLTTVQEKFPSNTLKDLGIPSYTWWPLELQFLLKPSFETMEFIRNTLGSKNKDEFLKKREILFQFLKKNIRYFEDAAIDIFTQLGMYEDLIDCLKKMVNANNYENNFTKINASIERLKRTGNNVKTTELAEALKDYVASALVEGSFGYVFRRHTRPIPGPVRDCVKLIYTVNRNIFMKVMQLAINNVTQIYLRNTIVHQKRIELGCWLKEIKDIFTFVKENKEWSTIFRRILEGPLKRKPQIICEIQRTPNIL